MDFLLGRFLHGFRLLPDELIQEGKKKLVFFLFPFRRLFLLDPMGLGISRDEVQLELQGTGGGFQGTLNAGATDTAGYKDDKKRNKDSNHSGFIGGFSWKLPL
jgi:hypothetical protein